MRGLCLLVATLIGAQPAQAQKPAPLDTADFVVGKLRYHMDSAAVRAALGPPDSVRPRQGDVEWAYGAATVRIGWQGAVVTISLTRPGTPTARGLQVGDSTSVLLALYGEPFDPASPVWDYSDPQDELHVMRVSVFRGRIRRIWFGWLEP